jgi:hypothetical protein
MREQEGNAKVLATLASTLLYIADLSARVPDLALEAARGGYEASGKNDALAISVYAQALYQVGALDKAIELQTDAVAKTDEASRKAAESVLAYYQACKKLQTAVQ